MSDAISFISELILAILIGHYFCKSFFAKDKTHIWSPITTVSLTYIYYCSMPFFGGVVDRYLINEAQYDGYLFHVAALLSYVFILLGFKTHMKRPVFKKWNKLFTINNAGIIGLVITFLGIICYATVRGFHFSFAAEITHDSMMVMGGWVYYYMMMLNILIFSAALLFIAIKLNRRKFFVYGLPMWLIFVHFLIAGARWRIVVVVITLLTVHYLYPKIKKVNVPIVATLAIVLYLGFSVMDKARIRGEGINMEKANALKYEDIKQGAGENSSVYSFSLMCMYRIKESGERVYFQPLLTALLMPIPRDIFPWKPDAYYLHKLEKIVLGNDESGAAYLNFVESYYSFGWFGVIFWAWILGWLARRFWDNYQRNKASIGAVVGLGVFSGLCYMVISRGYLAATLISIVFCLLVPFWIGALYNRFSPPNR
jgi:hypothetical protein